ncbi:uncharacterized protein LOC135334834 isoform X2 [Halichondria panicea]|uniref:uncharacterized protein LOC135334834 isoform X2 n=1 Tax=Halichondria panicea TaxID=6063 RepID=UPI00312B4700
MATTALQFTSADGSTRRQCRVLTVHLGQGKEQEQLQPWRCEDVLHAAAGLCSVCLPDMEISVIYNTLTTTNTIIALSTPQDALAHRSVVKRRPHKTQDAGNDVADDEDNCFADLFSGEESEESESEVQADVWEDGRGRFLKEARHRATLDNDIECIGPEHCVLGCASILSLTKSSKAVQVTLLAVRKSCRKLGIGRHLMQMCKDPEVVGLYDALLTFADPKAERFFQRHGFSDDPLLTAKYRAVVDHWENSSLMVYIPPFSSTGLAVGSLKSLVNFQESYKNWRDSALTSYSNQLCVMERLRHELLILHNKVESQEEVIGELASQLRASQNKSSTLEKEFTEYRAHTQKLLCSAAVDNAEKWIQSTN